MASCNFLEEDIIDKKIKGKKDMQEPSYAKITYLVNHINNDTVQKIFLHSFQYGEYFQVLLHLDKISHRIKMRNYCRTSVQKCACLYVDIHQQNFYETHQRKKYSIKSQWENHSVSTGKSLFTRKKNQWHKKLERQILDSI